MGSLDFFGTHPVFTLQEYADSRRQGGSAHPRTVENLLAEHVKAGHVLRVRSGLFASMPAGTNPVTFSVDPYLLAGHLASDAVVAFHAALQFRGKAYSIWKRYPYLTRKRCRPLSLPYHGAEYVAVQASKSIRNRPDLGGGIVEERHAGGTVRVTTFERTLVDIMDAPEHGGGWEEIWRSLEMVEFFDLDEVVRLTLDRSSALTVARVGFYMDQHRDALMVEDRHLAPLHARAPRQPRYLDRQRNSGRVVKAWNLVVPERVLNRQWEEVR